MGLKGIRLCDMGCTDLVQDRKQWQALVKMIMNLPSSIKQQEPLEKLKSIWLLKEWFP
jgi:hypothetical protein